MIPSKRALKSDTIVSYAEIEHDKILYNNTFLLNRDNYSDTLIYVHLWHLLVTSVLCIF